MKLLEVFRNNSSKFFSRNTICRTVKAGYVYVEDKKIWIPSETKLTIEHFDLYSNKVIALVDGRQRVEVTYEYLMDCVIPINTDVNQTVNGVQVLQRVNNIISNDMLVKIICTVLLFCIGLLMGKVM